MSDGEFICVGSSNYGGRYGLVESMGDFCFVQASQLSKLHNSYVIIMSFD